MSKRVHNRKGPLPKHHGSHTPPTESVMLRRMKKARKPLVPRVGGGLR